MSCIDFSDADFKLAISKGLALNGADINRDDLLRLNNFMITGKNVNDGILIPWSNPFDMMFPEVRYKPLPENQLWLKDLKYLNHIKALHIDTPTENLGVLKGFTNLQELYITNSDETDWSFLEGLTALQSLYIRNAQFSDLTPIANLCEKQYQKYTHSNEEGFCFLKNLYLNYCDIVDISPLKKCKFIGELDLSHNHIIDISPLKNVKRLFTLTLRYNKINDLSPLLSLPYIHSINARHNDVSNIKILLRFKSTNLTQLYLGDNPIKDYSPIKKINIPLCDINSLGIEIF